MQDANIKTQFSNQVYIFCKSFIEVGRYQIELSKSAMGWNGMEDGIKWKAHFGMEGGRCQGWNEMETLDNGMEVGIPSFHLNSFILYSFLPLHTNFMEQNCMKSFKSFYLVELKHYVYFYFESKRLPIIVRC